MQRSRLIMFGPKAQDVIQPFLLRRPDAFCFSPAEADAERRASLSEARVTPLSCGNGPGTNRRKSPKKKPGEHYTSASYYRAIQYACDKAFPPPERLRPKMLPNGKRETKRAFNARLKKKEAAELNAWRKAHRWHPHQLRHTAGTEIRRRFGLEAAQIVLGHSSAQITDAVYAERDVQKATEVMKQVG
jgi:integrase